MRPVDKAKRKDKTQLQEAALARCSRQAPTLAALLTPQNTSSQAHPSTISTPITACEHCIQADDAHVERPQARARTCAMVCRSDVSSGGM